MPSLLIKPVGNTNELEEITVESGKAFSSSKIAIIEVEGMLMNAREGGGFFGPEENKLSLFTQQLQAAERDGSVKAVVLRINSPGGDGHVLGHDVPDDPQVPCGYEETRHR
jgi:ClpP class serine protease